MVPRIAMALVVLLGFFPVITFTPAQNQKGGEPSRALPGLRDGGFDALADRGAVPDSFDQPAVQNESGVRIVNFPVGFAPSRSNNVVYSRDGRIGFVGSIFNDRLFAFDTTTGEMIGSVVVGIGPGGIAINEQRDKRIILVKNFGSDDVSIVDATDPAQMRVQATFEPPEGTDFAFAVGRPVISPNQKKYG